MTRRTGCAARDQEANIYQQGLRWATAVEIEKLPCPTKAIGSDPTVPHSFMPTVDLSELMVLDYDFVPETTHLLQLEAPGVCVHFMLEYLARALPSS